VDQTYRHLLGREAETAGLAGWTALLDQGVPRSEVVYRIENSAEGRIRQVQQLYGTLLGRPADPGGLTFFVSLLESRGTVEQARALMLGSPEYFQTRAGGSNSGFVTAVYQDVLGRPPEPSGARGWEGLLAEESSPSTVASEFANSSRSSVEVFRTITRVTIAFQIVSSPEADQHLVQNFYQKFLGRAAEPGGLGGWVATLQHGARDEQVIAGIVGSPEYFGHFAPATTSGKVVLDWNQTELAAIQQDGSSPPAASRSLAMVQAAVYDAVNAVQGKPGYYVTQPAPSDASPVAAVAAAAHRVLSYLYPAQKATFDAALTNSLSGVADGKGKTDGISAGESVADAVITLQAHDGFDAYVTYDGGTAPGQWQPTAPMYMAALTPQWATLEPFAMTSPEQFRPAGPPALTSQAWADAFNEVKSLGSATSTVRTADQTQIARFWADGSGTVTPAGHWNQIAGQVAQAQDLSLAEAARLFAEMDITLADAAIVAWDAKYHFGTWRPITAIPAAATTGNPNVQADPNWTPLLVTPNFPEYVSGHSTYSAAAAAVLTAAFGDNYSFTTGSPGLAGVTRSFASFDAAAAEAGRSRIYAGIHFQFSNQDGQAAGKALANYVLGTFAVSKDTTPPRVALDKVLPSGASNSNVTVTGRVFDHLSGVAKLEVQVDQGAYAPLGFDPGTGRFSFTTSFAVDGSADGSHTIGFSATDVAGNLTSPVTFTFLLGTRGPALTLSSPSAGTTLAAGATLAGSAATSGPALVALSYAIDRSASSPVSFTPDDGVFVFNQALDLSKLAAGAHTLTVTAQDAAGNITTQTLNLTLAAAIPLTITSLTPAAGAENVGVTFRPKVVFSRPIDTTTLTSANFFTTDPGGDKLTAAIVPADDGTSAWLFFSNPMPGASTIKLTVDGSTIKAADGSLLDAEGMGMPGSRLTSTFTTVSQTAILGTSLSGMVADPGPDLKPGTFDDVRPGPDGVLNTGDDIYLHPLDGVKVWILGLESQAVFTDTQGRFHFDAVPIGDVKLGLDGRTASNAPAGTYFPEMVMDLTIKLGQANTVIGSMGTPQEQAALAGVPGVYLPRLQTSLLHTLDASTGMHLGVDAVSAPNLTPGQQQLLSMDIPAGSLVGPDGKKLSSAQIGISTVPPELVRDMLPAGLLEHTFDITAQALGVATFSTPVPMTFPNLFNAAPGSQLNFLSFDHTTGRLVIQGTATVSADGRSVRTDPGIGITHPGWHGLTPPGTPIDPCPPVQQPPHAIKPVPFLGEVDPLDDIQDHLFVKDSDQFTALIRNDAVDSSAPMCSGNEDTPMRVSITVEGPAGKFLQGLPETGPGNFIQKDLEPGEEMELAIAAKPLLTPENLKAATADILYGVKVTVELDWLLDPPSEPQELKTKTFYLYRLFDAGDNDHEDGRLDFPRTLADGAGNFYQELPLKLDLPDSARPMAQPNSSNFHFVDDAAQSAKLQFDPAEGARGDIAGALDLTTPNGQFLTIHVQGSAVGPQKVFFSSALFDKAIARLVDGHTLNPDLKSLLFILPQDANHNGLLSDEPDFDSRVHTMYQVIVRHVIETFEQSVPGADTALTIQDAESGDGILVHSELSTDPTKLCTDPNAEGCAAWTDFDRESFNRFVSEEDRTSLLQQEFRFSQITNRSATDDGPGFNGVTLELDKIAKGSTVGSFLAGLVNTLAHELGHDLGAIHFRSASELYLPGVANFPEVMGSPPAVAPLAQFGGVFRPVIKFALGIPVSDHTRGQEDFEFAYSYYKDLVNLEDYAFNVGAGGGQPAGDTVADTRLPAAWLRVFAGPVLTGSPLPQELTSVDLGRVFVGGAAAPPGTMTLFLFNDGGEDLDISKVALLGGNAGFSVEGVDALPITLPALDPEDPQPSLSGHAITIRFAPSQPGPAGDVLRITSNSLDGRSLDIPLTGLGVSPFGELAVDVPNNNAGGAAVSGQPKSLGTFATLRNSGSQPLTITNIVPDDASIGQFTPSGLPAGFGPNQPLDLQPGDSFSLGVTFAPTLIGIQRGHILISSDDLNRPVFDLPVVGTGEPDSGSALMYAHDFVALEEPFNASAPVLRQLSDDQGNWTFFLPPRTPIHYTIFDPVSGLVAHGFDTTADSGQTTVLSPPVFQASTAPDSDGDGLPDDVEFAVGSSPHQADTDGNGIDDYASILLGQDPLGGRPLPTGVIASVSLPGAPRKVVAAGNTAYVATSAGIAAADVTQLTRPAVVGQLSLANVSDFGIDPQIGMAAAATGTSVALLDVSDPTHLVVRQMLPLSATHVEVVDGLGYAAANSDLDVIDLVTGEEEQRLPLGLPQNAGIASLAHEGNQLYVLDTTGTLSVIDISTEGSARVVSSFKDDTLTHFGLLAVSNGVVYLSGGQANSGFAAVDVTDPTRPVLLAGPQVSFDSEGGMAVDAGGLALVGGLGTSGTTLGISVFDVTDPRNTGAFLFRVLTPQVFPVSLAVSSGLAFAAESSAFQGGSTILNVINFQSNTAAGQPPSVTVSTPLPDLDPDTPGLQLAEATTIPIQVRASSKTPVREVQLLLNGRVVSTATTPPFDSFEIAPTIAADGTTITVQVRATYSDGSTDLSNPLTIGLLPLLGPPLIVNTDPADGAQVPSGRQLIRVTFSQRLAPATVTTQTFQLRDTSGRTLTPRNLQLRHQNMLVQLAYDPLPAGTYELVIAGASVTNLTGTALAAGDVISSHFTVQAAPRSGPLFPDPMFRLPPRLGIFPPGGNDLITADMNGDGRADLVSFRDDLGNVSVLLSRGDGSFGPPINDALNLPSGSGLWGLAAADLNGDGRPDVVTLWHLAGSQTVTAIVLLGMGDGTFASRTDYPLNSINFSLNDVVFFAFGDLTGDGRPDIVVEKDVAGDSTHPVRAHFVVLPGNGDGTFGTPIESTTDSGLEPTAMFALADVNGDGRLDLVAVSQFVTVLLGQGDGTFGNRQDSLLPLGFLNPSLMNTPGHVQLVADFASDATPASETVSVLPINTDGTLGSQRDIFVGPPGGGSVAVAAVTDLNGDGRADLVLNRGVGSRTHLTVLLQNADGTFSQGDDFDLEFGEAKTLADVNGDGHPDAILVRGDLGYVLLNDGQGQFLHQPNYQVGPPGSGLGSSFGVDNGQILTLADLNGDGKLDIVTALQGAGTDSSLTVQLGNGDGTFRPASDIPLENSSSVIQVSSFLLADVYGNGKLDVVTETFLPNNLGISILPSNGDGTFATRTDLGIDILGLSQVTPLAVGDVNGDGHPDIITQAIIGIFPASAGMLVLYGHADGSFTFNPQAPFLTGVTNNINVNGTFGSLTLADVNGNGIVDLVFLDVKNGTEVESVVLGDPNLGATDFTPTRIDLPVPPGSRVLRVADLNNDGRLDLVAPQDLFDVDGSPLGFRIAVSLGRGDGTFEVPINSDFLDPSSGLAFGLVLGDVDGDGSVDVVLANSRESGVMVLHGNGDGTFGPPTEFAVEMSPVFLRLGELDNNGTLDFVTAASGPDFSTVSPRLNRLVT
jgi:hypothetical protein